MPISDAQPRETSSTLLERLRDPADDAAWNRFVRFYRPVIIAYARRCGCGEELAEEVLQESLIDLVPILRDFTYDRGRGRFRTFLYRLVRNRVRRAFRREQKRRSRRHDGRGPGEQGTSIIEKLPEPRGEDVWEREWRERLLYEALRQLRQRVETRTFEAFRDHMIRERPVAEICEAYGYTANALYQIKYRVLKLLRLEVMVLAAEVEGG